MDSVALTLSKPLTIEITLDNWPSETGWSFVSGDGSTEIPDGTYTFQDVGQTYTYNVCAMESGFEFIISDTYGDGLAGSTSGGNLDGDVLIRGCNGDTITQLSNGNWLNVAQENVGVGFGNVAYSGWQEVPVCGGPEEVLGCLDSDYQEFNPLANIDDGSCETGGPSVIDYCIDLHFGANLVSFYALPDDVSVGNMMSSLDGVVTGVIGEGVAASPNPVLGWVGSLSNISPTDTGANIIILLLENRHYFFREKFDGFHRIFSTYSG